ncbi:ACP7 [Cordylochernes scorpioides]|uniref:ACP7 n=1 Tax=Cordylochernes scorpioides TaxID=51811 RepID=A0ABY6L1A1_9ARAC|nr:ACP7 [Cordylochernes scorpioides]
MTKLERLGTGSPSGKRQNWVRGGQETGREDFAALALAVGQDIDLASWSAERSLAEQLAHLAVRRLARVGQLRPWWSPEAQWKIGDNHRLLINQEKLTTYAFRAVGPRQRGASCTSMTEKAGLWDIFKNHETGLEIVWCGGSFNIGPVHILSFSSEFYYWDGYEEMLDNQYRWIIADLEIRVGMPGTQKYALEEVFFKYGVDLEIWAHEHTYERTWPLYNQTVYNGSLAFPYTNPGAPTHLITGSSVTYPPIL